jgi:hypothetical protein
VIKMLDSWSNHQVCDIFDGWPHLWPWASHFTSIFSSFELDVKLRFLVPVFRCQGKHPTWGKCVAVDSPSPKTAEDGITGPKWHITAVRPWEWKYEFTVHFPHADGATAWKFHYLNKFHYFPFKIIQLSQTVNPKSQTWFSIEKHYICI